MVTANPLPAALEEYLAASNCRVTHLYQPTWIKGALDADYLEIDFLGVTDSAWARKSAFYLPTSFYAPPGRLSTGERAIFRKHLILLLISFIDGAIAPSRSAASCRVLWRAACCLVEYWVGVAPRARLSLGLAGVDLDTISELLISYRETGREGALDLRRQWDTELSRLIRGLSAPQRAAIEAAASPNRTATIHRVLDALNTARDTRSVAFDRSIDLRLALFLLDSQDAYDSDGLVRSAFVASILGIEARRVAVNRPLQFHLRAYALSDNFSRQDYRKYGHRSEPNNLRVLASDQVSRLGQHRIDVLAAGLRYASLSACNVGELRDCALASPERVAARIASVDRPDAKRTPTIPVQTALQLIQRSIDWIVNVGPQIEEVCKTLIEVPFPRRKNGRPHGFSAAMSKALADLEHPLLLKHGVTSFWGQSRRCDPVWSKPSGVKAAKLAFSDLLDLHYAVCFSVVALMGCMRKEEVKDLLDVDLVPGRPAALETQLRKRGVDTVRRRRVKPIPAVAAMAIESQIRIRDMWRTCLPASLGGAAHVFSVINRNGLSASHDVSLLYNLLDFLSEYFELSSPSGERWYIRPHQLRKCFAMTFFHHGGREKSLPALSWFMGHRGVADTWRYVRNQLTGSEVTSAEAQLATLAVLSTQKSKAVQGLREVLLKHFQCDSLSVMNEEEVQAYLEFLHKKGAYQATPVEIRTAKGSRVSVLIAIQERL